MPVAVTSVISPIPDDGRPILHARPDYFAIAMKPSEGREPRIATPRLFGRAYDFRVAPTAIGSEDNGE